MPTRNIESENCSVGSSSTSSSTEPSTPLVPELLVWADHLSIVTSSSTCETSGSSSPYPDTDRRTATSDCREKGVGVVVVDWGVRPSIGRQSDARQSHELCKRRMSKPLCRNCLPLLTLFIRDHNVSLRATDVEEDRRRRQILRCMFTN